MSSSSVPSHLIQLSVQCQLLWYLFKLAQAVVLIPLLLIACVAWRFWLGSNKGRARAEKPRGDWGGAMLLSVDVNAFAVAFPRTSLRLFFTGIYVITAFVFVLAPQFSYQLTMHSTYNSSLICQSLLCTGFIHSNLSPYCHHSFRVPSFARVTSDIALHNQSCLSLWSILLKQ